MSNVCTQERFLRDVESHEMIVIRDDGVNRHIRFKRPGTSCMYFDLITWPGCLCYTGDMGTYVFRRLNDMFEFFRTDRAYRRDPGKLAINIEYWAEKLIAVDGNRRGGGVKEFDEDKFKRVINEYRVRWIRDAKVNGTIDKAGRRSLWEAVDDQVLSELADRGGEMAKIAAYDFEFYSRTTPGSSYVCHFEDLFEHDFTEYTHSIVWCCYALAWGIQKYDESNELVTAGATDETSS